MQKKRTIQAGVLNIKTHPHSPEGYINLFQKAYELEILGKIRGSDWGVIGTINENKSDYGYHVLYGTIYKFLNIDPKSTWLDLKTRIPLNTDKEDVAPVIPDHLKPNLKEIRYVFYPQKHRLCFDTENISPRSIKSLMESIFSRQVLIDDFGMVNIEIESTYDVFRKIISIPQITSLEIMMTRPNADELAEEEQRVLDRIINQNIRRHEQISSTTDKEGIRPDEDTKALMKIALSNGRIIAKGYESESKKVVYSTEEHPVTETLRYDTTIASPMHALMELGDRIIQSIMDRIRGNK